MNIEIRDAVDGDALAACEVLRQSITEICVADHANNPIVLEQWLSNKTAENIRAWIAQTNNSILVAVDDGSIVAIGGVTDAGKITLNYVAPKARFRGVSRALLAALEHRAADRGNKLCSLVSTRTARRFYLANGYVESPVSSGELASQSGYPMSKPLGTD